MSDYYQTLWVEKTASEAEIKKAYKKKAMEYHPDRNKGDKKAEAKFKEINEAYQTIGDKEKRKQYDTFWSAGSQFHGAGRGNPYGGSAGGFGGYEDIFSSFGGGGRRSQQSQGFEFDLGDIFSQMNGGNSRSHTKTPPRDESRREEIENLDVTETVEIPFFDFLFDQSITVRTVYGKTLTLKAKANTKPGTKYKIAGKGRTSGGRTGDMFVIVDVKMPREISPQVMKMIEAIRYQV